MNKLVLLCDMDGILVNLFTYWLDAIEARHGVKVGPEEITRWDLHNCGALKDLGAVKVYEFLQEPGFFRNAPAYPGALETLKRIKEDLGFDIVIASSPSGPVSAKEKLEWLEEHAPWIDSKNIFLGNRKTLIKGDVLIDDHPDTMVKYHEAWPEALIFGIGYPYNEHVEDFVIGSYEDTQAAWNEIYNHLRLTAFVNAALTRKGNK